MVIGNIRFNAVSMVNLGRVVQVDPMKHALTAPAS